MKKRASVKEPVNVVVSYAVKEGKEKEFERTIHRTIKAALLFTGNQGATVIKDEGRRYHVVYRFSDPEKLNRWLGSKERRRLLANIGDLVEDKMIEVQKITGFETWFNASTEPYLHSPPRWKMLLVTFLGAYPVVILFQWLIVPHIIKWQLLLRSLAFPVIILTIMTYLVMPVLTRFLHGWLYKRNG